MSAGGREELESAIMTNRRDQRHTFEGSRGGDKPEEEQQLRATGQRARRATTPCYCPVSAGGREDPESANMANRRDRRPTFEGSRGVRYQNIANRRDERHTFVKNSRLASTVWGSHFRPDGSMILRPWGGRGCIATGQGRQRV